MCIVFMHSITLLLGVKVVIDTAVLPIDGFCRGTPLEPRTLGMFLQSRKSNAKNGFTVLLQTHRFPVYSTTCTRQSLLPLEPEPLELLS